MGFGECFVFLFAKPRRLVIFIVCRVGTFVFNVGMNGWDSFRW